MIQRRALKMRCAKNLVQEWVDYATARREWNATNENRAWRKFRWPSYSKLNDWYEDCHRMPAFCRVKAVPITFCAPKTGRSGGPAGASGIQIESPSCMTGCGRKSSSRIFPDRSRPTFLQVYQTTALWQHTKLPLPAISCPSKSSPTAIIQCRDFHLYVIASALSLRMRTGSLVAPHTNQTVMVNWQVVRLSIHGPAGRLSNCWASPTLRRENDCG